MPDDPQDLSAFVNPPQVPSDTGADPKDILASLFGPGPEPSGPAPLPKEDSATVMGSGLKTGMEPHPIDAPSVQLFNFMYGHKFKPVIQNGKPVYNADGTPQYEKRLDETGHPIIDPKTGNPVLELSPYYVSPARKILQGVFANALGMGMPAIYGHPDVMREMKKEQYNTDQQIAMEAAAKNLSASIQMDRQNRIDARQKYNAQVKYNVANLKDQEFQQTMGFRKDTYNLAVLKNTQYQDAQAKLLKNQDLNREEKLLVTAYGPAAAQAIAAFQTANPDATREEALKDPHVLMDAQERYEQMKPEAAYNAAVQKMLDAGELAGIDPTNQSALYKASQESKALDSGEKKDVATYLLKQMQGQTNRIQQIQESNKGRVAAAGTPRPQSQRWYIPDENGNLKAYDVTQPGQEVPANAMSQPTASGLNAPTTPTKGAAEQGGIIQTSAKHLQDVVDTINSHGKLGNMAAVWKSLTNDSPVADPEIAYLKTSIKSFADLNPKLHGFRGQQIGQEFEKSIGGPIKNPEALKAAIQAIADQAGIISSTVPSIARRQGNQGKTVEHWDFDKNGKLVKSAPAR